MATPKKGRNPANLVLHQANFAYIKKDKPMTYKYYMAQISKINEFKNKGWDVTKPLQEITKYYERNGLPDDGSKTKSTSTRSRSAPTPAPQPKQPQPKQNGKVVPLPPDGGKAARIIAPAPKKVRRTIKAISTPKPYRKLLRHVKDKETYRKMRGNVPLNNKEYTELKKHLEEGNFGNLVNVLKAYHHQAMNKKTERAKRYFEEKERQKPVDTERAKRYFEEKERQKPVEIATQGDEVEEVKMTAKEENKDKLKSQFYKVKSSIKKLDDHVEDVFDENYRLYQDVDKLEGMMFA